MSPDNPHSGLGGFVPIPIKLREDKRKVITGNRSKACLIRGGSIYGNK